MATYRELLTKWSFDIEHEKLDKAEKQIESIKHLLELVAGAEIVKKLYEITENFAKWGEQLHVAAESAGLTVEQFQKLSFAAQQSNISSEEMGMAMARLSRHLYEARRGSDEAQRAFAEAGFTPQQIAGFRTGQDALLALSDRFRQIHDPIQKSALAMQLMGRGSVHMVGFLSQGSAAIKAMGVQAEELGIILSEQQVKALVDVEHAMLRFWGVVKGMAATFAAQLGPSLVFIVDRMIAFYRANRQVIETNLQAWFYDITYAMGFLYGVVEIATKKFLEFAGAHPVLVRRLGEVVLALGALFTTLALGKTAWNYMVAPVLALAEYAFPLLTGALGGFIALLEATPIGWVVTGLSAVGLALDALWDHFVEGKDWKDTWLGKVADAAGWVADKLGFGGGPGSELQSLQSPPNPASFSPVGPGYSRGGGGAEVSIDARSQITVGGPVDQHSLDALDKKLHEHTDRIARHVSRTLKGPQAY